MRRAALIFNPKAGKGRHAERLPALLAALRRGGIAATPHPTAAPGHATTLAREASGSFDLVLAYGGDGTVREAAGGLLGGATPLGILPGGTTNVLARALDLPLDPLATASLLGGLPVRPLDVGLAGEEPFLMMVSAGLDALSLARVDPGLKRRFGQPAIAAQAIREWWRYGYPEMELRSEGCTLHGSFISISNITLYGGKFLLAPRARPDDGWLDALALQGKGRRATLGFALDLGLARLQDRPGIEMCRLKSALLDGPAEVAFQIDGDVASAKLPIAIGLSPHRLAVLAPQPFSDFQTAR